MDNGACSYRRYLDGDDSAFDEIVTELFEKLVFFVDGYVHDLSMAEDIAVDAFTQLILHKHRYNFSVTLKTYLFMIGRSRALNVLKHRRRFSVVSLDAEIPADRQSLEEHFLADEEKRRLHAAIADLPGDMRAAIHLVYFEELSYEEAAKVLKKNRKQIDNLLYRAKRELRTILTKDGETV